MLDSISEARLTPINPTLANRVRQMASVLGFDIRVTRGAASADEQMAYYAQGRLPVSTVNILRGKVKLAPLTEDQNVKVTDAPPGHSWHEYLFAVDVVPMTPVPDYNENHPTWRKILEVAPQFQLTDGVHWKDEPHLQPIELPDSPTPVYVGMLHTVTMEEIWRYAGLAA